MLESDNALSSLTATIAAANSISALNSTPQDVRACAQLVIRVYDDLQFLVTLRSRHRSYLKTSPLDSQCIDNIVSDTINALLNVGYELESYTVRINGGKLPFLGRLKWRSSDSERFLFLSRGLGMPQAAIFKEIDWLRKLKGATSEDVGMASESGNVDDGDFENVELLRLSPRNLAVLRGKSSTTAPLPYEENGLHESSSQMLPGNASGSYSYVGPGKSSHQTSTTESQLLSIDDGGANTSITIEDHSQFLPPNTPPDSEQSFFNSTPQNTPTTTRPRSHINIEPPAHQKTLALATQRIHPRTSTTSLSSTSTRGRSNTFAMQALRESETEEDFTNYCSSPSSASFMSSRLSTISSRTSVGSLSRNGSQPRSKRRPPKPPKLLVFEPFLSQDAGDIVSCSSDLVAAEMSGVTGWCPIPSLSAGSLSPSPLQPERVLSLEGRSVSERSLVGDEDQFHQNFLPQPHDLTSKPSRISIQTSIEDGDDMAIPLTDAATTTVSFASPPLSNSFNKKIVSNLGGAVQSSDPNQFEHAEYREVFNEHLGDPIEDPEDFYFRELRLQELEKKKRLAAGRK